MIADGVLVDEATGPDSDVATAAGGPGRREIDSRPRRGMRPGRRWWVWIAVAAVVVAAAGGVTWGLIGGPTAGVSLVEGFPKDLPLADGDVIASQAVSGSAFAATVRVEGLAAQDAALTKLEEAGFNLIGSVERDEVRTYSFNKPGQGVTLVLSTENGVPVVAYTVSVRS